MTFKRTGSLRHGWWMKDAIEVRSVLAIKDLVGYGIDRGPWIPRSVGKICFMGFWTDR